MIFFKSKKVKAKEEKIQKEEKVAKQKFDKANEELKNIIHENGFHLQLYRAINGHGGKS